MEEQREQTTVLFRLIERIYLSKYNEKKRNSVGNWELNGFVFNFRKDARVGRISSRKKLKIGNDSRVVVRMDRKTLIDKYTDRGNDSSFTSFSSRVQEKSKHRERKSCWDRVPSGSPNYLSYYTLFCPVKNKFSENDLT